MIKKLKTPLLVISLVIYALKSQAQNQSITLTEEEVEKYSKKAYEEYGRWQNYLNDLAIIAKIKDEKYNVSEQKVLDKVNKVMAFRISLKNGHSATVICKSKTTEQHQQILVTENTISGTLLKQYKELGFCEKVK